MIDRPLRPLFPKGWHRETQLVGMPLSVDQVHSYDILAMNGASAALMVSDIPFPTPVGAVRIGKVEGNFVVNPTEEQQLTADLDLVVAGTEEAILMVEGGFVDIWPEDQQLTREHDQRVGATEGAALMDGAGANEEREAGIRDARDIAHSAMKKHAALQRGLAEKAGKPKLEIEPPQVD